MYIETKNYIPFEDKVYPEHTYIYLKIKKARTQEEKDYLKKHYIDCQKAEKSYEDYKEFLYESTGKNANKIDFYNYLYHYCDLGSGKITYHYICNEYQTMDFVYDTKKENYPFLTNNSLKRPVIRKYKNKQLFIYDTITYDDILIFRFYKHKPDYFKEGVKQGFYEIFRVCFKGSECWGENRETTYNFNIEFLMQSEKLYKYNKYTRVNRTLYDNVNKVFPIIYNISNLYNESVYQFTDFCKKWHKLYKTNTIFKNVPKNIVLDLKKKENITKNISKEKTYFCKIKSTKEFVCFHIFINQLEIERIYFDKNKVYKFGYNFFENSWTSTKREKLYANSVTYENVIYAKTYKDEEMQNTILNRYMPKLYLSIKNKKDNMSQNTFAIAYRKKYFVSDILIQHNCILYEQIQKLGFERLKENYRTDKGTLYLFADVFSIENRKLTIKEVKKMQLHELFGITSKQLKFVPRNINIYQAEQITKRMHSKKWETNFKDATIRIQIASLSISDTKINKIIKIMKDNDKNYISFFMALLKKDNPERYIDMYCDYLKIRNLANRYGGFEYKEIISPSDIEFMHNMAYRDYLYQKQLEQNNNNKKKPKISKKEKFVNFINTEEYKQFMYNEKGYQIIGAKEPNDLIIEGRELSHCVGGYVNRMANKKSFIYFIRQENNLEKPFYTIEVNRMKIKNKNEYQYYLNQCYGYSDTTEKSEGLRKFIQKWAEIKNVKILCRV